MSTGTSTISTQKVLPNNGYAAPLDNHRINPSTSTQKLTTRSEHATPSGREVPAVTRQTKALNPAAKPFRPATKHTTPATASSGLTYGEAEVELPVANQSFKERVEGLKKFFCDPSLERTLNSDREEFRRQVKAQGFKTLEDSRWAK
ncbi:hypothetical protein F5Y18DRAFT_431731 [Xylariaceae sp. FL1019]|nr:hypothetical protein F5Y18DRAFT_431731 [Xylariaceae sp. FL1019]